MRRVGEVSEGMKCVRKMTMSMCATVNLFTYVVSTLRHSTADMCDL